MQAVTLVPEILWVQWMLGAVVFREVYVCKEDARLQLSFEGSLTFVF